MTVTTHRSATNRMTLEAFLSYDDGTENRYELVDGVLVEMGTESTINTQIASFLHGFFILFGLPAYRIGFKQKVEVQSLYSSARDPDLMIHTEDSEAAIHERSEACLKLHDPNPMLLIEVASPGAEPSDNYQRDYVQKVQEYADRGVLEYWIIDPASDRAGVKVGTWVNGQYEFQTFRGQEIILSHSFPTINLKAEQILTAGR